MAVVSHYLIVGRSLTNLSFPSCFYCLLLVVLVVVVLLLLPLLPSSAGLPQSLCLPNGNVLPPTSRGREHFNRIPTNTTLRVSLPVVVRLKALKLGSFCLFPWFALLCLASLTGG